MQLNTEMMGSNPARGMDMCPRFSVLCCSVQVQAMRWTDPPSKESYQNVKMHINNILFHLHVSFHCDTTKPRSVSSSEETQLEFQSATGVVVARRKTSSSPDITSVCSQS
jgi:hypothetical protein